jgi:hypothetical protein
MKKHLLRIVLAVFFFAGLAFIKSLPQVYAQNNTVLDHLYDPPSGQFVDAQVAILRLDQAIVPLKTTMLNYSAGGPEYDQAFRKYSYFNAITNYIVEGKTVPVSIVDALKVIASDVYAVPPKTLADYKLEAINLLRP